MAVFLPQLQASGFLDRLSMTVCNVGSRKLGATDDYAGQGWQIFAPNLTIIGFDADADACFAANAELSDRQITWREEHVPLVLSDRVGEAPLYVTKHPMCSSLYPPNEPYLARFAGLSELMDLNFTVEVETTTLDEFCQQENIETIDFLQVDVQGADLQVLQGAEKRVSQNILAVQVEAIFSPLYQNQPLFADIDRHLRDQGFTLFDLTKAYRPRRRSPIYFNKRPGQLLWGDAFYLRDLLDETREAADRTPEKIFKLACIADILNFSDYTLELLEYLTLNYGNEEQYNFADTILKSLEKFPQLVHQGLDTLPIIQRIKPYCRTTTTPSLPKPAATGTRKLHIGGKIAAPDWEIFNAVAAANVDHVGNANDLSRFPDNTFAELYASHVVEHFDYAGELVPTLKEWHRILQPGGKLYISVPDLDILCKLFISPILSFQERHHVMRMMFGGHVDRYDYHVVGLNEEFLRVYLQQAGFTSVEKVEEFKIFQDTSSMRFKGALISLNVIAIKS